MEGRAHRREPPKENSDPKRFSWLECEPLPLPHLWEGSRGGVIEAKIADASGRAAGKVMLEALEVEPAQEAGIFASGLLGGRRPGARKLRRSGNGRRAESQDPG